VLTRWSEQMQYMKMTMRWGTFMSALILSTSVITQLAGCAGVVTRTKLKHGAWLLLLFTIVQPFIYWQLHEADFMARSFTQIGGLLLLIRHEESIAMGGSRRGSSNDAFAGMGDGSGVGRRGASGARMQLVGRSLLMLIFFFQGARHLYSRGLTALSVTGYLVLLTLCALVLVGFKTRWSAVILAAALGVSNLWMYPFWAVRAAAACCVGWCWGAERDEGPGLRW
jgi:uncharacterized membrane protein YphA (DoxX/SURF4 family)